MLQTCLLILLPNPWRLSIKWRVISAPTLRDGLFQNPSPVTVRNFVFRGLYLFLVNSRVIDFLPITSFILNLSLHHSISCLSAEQCYNGLSQPSFCYNCTIPAFLASFCSPPKHFVFSSALLIQTFFWNINDKKCSRWKLTPLLSPINYFLSVLARHSWYCICLIHR